MSIQPQDLYELSVKSLANANELVEEAQLLFDHRRWPRVVFLCQIAGEELAKCFMSLTAIPRYAFETFNESTFLRRLRDHREKTGEIDFFEQLFVGSDSIEHRDRAWRNDFERFKLLSLYTDFFQGHAIQPSDGMTEAVALAALTLSNSIQLNTLGSFGAQVIENPTDNDE